MREAGGGRKVRATARALVATARTGTRVTARGGRFTGRAIHRMTRASGAGRTGLANLIELSAAGAAGDAFVTVALAGTLFFSASLDQARGRVALALVVTMAPFAVLAPLIGPMLDRVQQGRRFLLAGTLLARGLLCWGMAGAILNNDAITLLPAAFGVLVMQKAYGVTRSSITPRLLPEEITLVTANARMSMASLVSSGAALALAGGIDLLAGGGVTGAAWSLRVGTVVYLAAAALSFRIPEQVDSPEAPADAPAPALAVPQTAARAALPGTALPVTAAPTPGPAVTAAGAVPVPRPPLPGTFRATPARVGAARAGATRQGTARPAAGRDRAARAGGRKKAGEAGHAHGGAPPAAGGGRWRTLRRVGPVVGEAMRVNATLRAFSGFMVLFLAFLLRIEHFPGVNDKIALGAMIAAAGAGGFLGTAVGSALRPRRPHLITFGMLAAATMTTALCAACFGLWAALIVALVAAFGQVLGKLALDSTVQREIGEEIRTSTFAVSETLHQLSWVAGALAGLAMSFASSGVAGLAVAAVGLATSLTLLLARRRRRVLAARHG